MGSPASSISAVGSPAAGLGPSSEDAAALLASSFFPAPPAAYKGFTSRNLELARLIVAQGPALTSEWRQEEQDRLLESLGCEERPDFDLRELIEPPRTDWVIDQGGWDAFADTWPVDEHLPTLEEMGVQQLYISGQDRRESLHRLLNTVLVTFIHLIDVMLKPPPSLSFEAMKDFDPENPQPTEAQQLIQHIRIACINMHHLCNELRPVQARESLQAMMKEQIDRRRGRTMQLKQTCSKISDTLATLRTKYDLGTMDVDAAATAVEAHDPLPGDEADWRRVVAAVDGLSGVTL